MTNTNVSPVMLWAENAVEQEKGFLPAVLEAMDQFEQGNRTDLSILLTVTHGFKTDLVPVIEKQRMEYATPLKKILAACMPDLRFKKDAKKASGVAYTMELSDDADYYVDPTDARDALRVIVAEGHTRKGDAFKGWLKAVTRPKEVVAKTAAETREKAEKDAPRLAKTAAKAGHDNMAYMMALRDALSNEIAKQQTRLAIAAE